MQERYEMRVMPQVEAVPITPDSAKWASEWCKGVLMQETCPDSAIVRVVGVGVPTQYGRKIAAMGDYLVKKMSGDFTTESAASFDRKYIRATS